MEFLLLLLFGFSVLLDVSPTTLAFVSPSSATRTPYNVMRQSSQRNRRASSSSDKDATVSLGIKRDNDADPSNLSRRDFWTKAAGASASFAAALIASPGLAGAAEDNKNEQDGGFTVVKTPSGLKYIDLQPGTGSSPEYGNLCSISYKAYVKLPGSDAQPQKFDQTDGYLLKHGNGRMIAGLDEGLHTMKVGGVRRILIPPKLGFVDVGLGPLPEMPWNRYKLNNLLDQMVAVAGGTIIYEVRLRNVIVDEADQGYYEDDSLTPEEFETLRENLRIKASERLKKEAAENSLGVTGQERLL